MVEDQKFYVTPTRILDADIIGDVQYFSVGSSTGSTRLMNDGGFQPELRKKSELHIAFKDNEKDGICLYGARMVLSMKDFQSRFKGKDTEQTPPTP